MPPFKVKVYYINKDTTEWNWGKNAVKYKKILPIKKKTQTKNLILNQRGINSAASTYSARRKLQSSVVLTRHEEGRQNWPL